MNSIHDPRYIKMVQLLRKIRKDKGITQVELSSLLSWTQQDISRTESRVRRLDFIELCDWLDALGYDIKEFLKDLGR